MPSHPLVKHWLAVARNRLSPPPIFRSALAELGRVLIYEAAHDWLPTIDGQVCSRVAVFSTQQYAGVVLGSELGRTGPLCLLPAGLAAPVVRKLWTSHRHIEAALCCAAGGDALRHS